MDKATIMKLAKQSHAIFHTDVWHADDKFCKHCIINLNENTPTDEELHAFLNYSN